MGKIIKFICDYIMALILGVISFPFIIIALIVVFLFSPKSGSPLFIQKRVGYKGRIFTILKIRTMTNEKDENGNLLPDEKRLKMWGKIIRKTNIDELTQIWNILIFQMSFIGPRPLLLKEMDVMSKEEQDIRQSMLPGITGWEAVNEGKSKNRYEMAQFDLEYIENWSLLFDLKILFKTIKKIFTFDRPDDSVRAPKVENELNEKEE